MREVWDRLGKVGEGKGVNSVSKNTGYVLKCFYSVVVYHEQITTTDGCILKGLDIRCRYCKLKKKFAYFSIFL